jgi:hypothetical protein
VQAYDAARLAGRHFSLSARQADETGKWGLPARFVVVFRPAGLKACSAEAGFLVLCGHRNGPEKNWSAGVSPEQHVPHRTIKS